MTSLPLRADGQICTVLLGVVWEYQGTVKELSQIEPLNDYELFISLDPTIDVYRYSNVCLREYQRKKRGSTSC